MNNWIPFSDGEYLVEQALLLAVEDRAVSVEEVIVEIYSDRQGRRYLKGRGRVRNILMVELLEDSDDLDLLLDFGEEFKFLLKEPNLQVGKVFSPDVKSALQFTPRIPWRQIQQTEFGEILSRLHILSV
ncbi:MAG: hypothetical protein PVH85_11175 [Desulfobacterales bacterium]|jgi:hypothetical protein